MLCSSCNNEIRGDEQYCPYCQNVIIHNYAMPEMVRTSQYTTPTTVKKVRKIVATTTPSASEAASNETTPNTTYRNSNISSQTVTNYAPSYQEPVMQPTTQTVQNQTTAIQAQINATPTQTVSSKAATNSTLKPDMALVKYYMKQYEPEIAKKTYEINTLTDAEFIAKYKKTKQAYYESVYNYYYYYAYNYALQQVPNETTQKEVPKVIEEESTVSPEDTIKTYDKEAPKKSKPEESKDIFTKKSVETTVVDYDCNEDGYYDYTEPIPDNEKRQLEKETLLKVALVIVIFIIVCILSLFFL